MSLESLYKREKNKHSHHKKRPRAGTRGQRYLTRGFSLKRDKTGCSNGANSYQVILSSPFLKSGKGLFTALAEWRN